MPSYNALGVKASLSVTPLASTLNNDITLRMGKAQATDADRILALLRNGRKLPECPIGADGVSKVGVMQFIGENEDLAMFMVEASDGLRAETTAAPSFPTLDSLKSAESAFANLGSPKPEAGFMTAPETQPSTPAIDTEQILDEPDGNIRKLKKTKTKQPKRRLLITSKKSKTASTFGLPSVSPSSPAPILNAFTIARDPLALTLTLEYSGRTFLRGDCNSNGTGKDLKIEIIVNGLLAAVDFQPSRKSGLELATQSFSGTRLHRQSEKPWIYVQKTGPNFLDGGAAEQRWNSISNALWQEADARGTDLALQRPLTGEYLVALSQIPLPQRVGAKGASFGVIDILITAGKGRKFGPETIYQRAPTRMENRKYKATNVKPATISDSDPALQQDSDDFSQLYGDPAPNTTNSPYFTRSQGAPQAEDTPVATPERATMPRASEAYREVLRVNPFNQKVGAYDNAHGRPGSQRTLKQRLGDMIKMSPTKRQEAYEDLETKLDEETLRKVRRALEMEEEGLANTPSKKAQSKPEPLADNVSVAEMSDLQPEEQAEDIATTKVNTRLHSLNFGALANTGSNMDDFELDDDRPTKKVGFAPMSSLDMSALVADEGQDVFMETNDNTLAGSVDPFKATNNSSSQGAIDPKLLDPFLNSQPLPESTDAAAMLARTRMDTALEYGLDSNGTLLNHMASTSWQRKPLHRTLASALTGAPCHVPVKTRQYTSTRRVHTSKSIAKRSPSSDPLVLDPVLSTTREDSPSIKFATPACKKRAVTPKTTPQQSTPGSNRNKRRWNPDEQTPDAALENFEIPDLCVGSAVTYSEHGTQRQIKKERNGEFDEQVFIVGMRFIVF